MPIYEYRCAPCQRRVQVLTLRVSERPQPICDRCGNRDLERMPSRFAVARSEESRLDALSDPSQLAGVDENDPRSVARWMRRMSKEIGDEAAGPELDEMIDELESGGGSLDGDSDGGFVDGGASSDDA